jgi:hypothetical protein
VSRRGISKKEEERIKQRESCLRAQSLRSIRGSTPAPHGRHHQHHEETGTTKTLNGIELTTITPKNNERISNARVSPALT